MDKRFKPLSRGRQASATSAVAAICAQLFEPRDWTPSIVDHVLEYGDRLFRLSQARSRLPDDAFMTTGLLLQEFFVGDYKCRMCVEAGLTFGNIGSEAVGAPCLSHGLGSFLEARNFGVLTSQGISVAIWKHPPCGYFCFDPAPSDEQGKRNTSGFACLIRSNDVDGILQVFLGNLNRKYDSRYCIDKVSLIKVKPIGRGKYQSQNAGDVVIDKKILQTINPVDLQDNKLDCSKTPAKINKVVETSSQLAKADEATMLKVPLNIEITNYAVGAMFAAAPLTDQQLRDEKYTYDDVCANVPSTFSALPGDHSGAVILHGWTHEASDVYKAKGAQSVANCVMAIGTKKVYPVKTWLRQTLDHVLAMGDAIYAEVKAAKPSVKTMTAADLDDARFKIESRKMIVDVDLLTVVGTIVSKVSEVLNLKQGLEEFFIKNTDGVLECSSMAVAIWMQDDYYYLFDSKSCDMSGLHVVEEQKGKKGKGEEVPIEKKVIGKCCVIRFINLNSLNGHFLKNLDSTKTNDRFTVRRVKIVDDVPGIRDWNSFRPATAGKSWVLRGSLNSDDESFDDHSRGAQGLAIPVVALVSAKSITPSKWSREDVDDVVREGDVYYNWCIPASEEGDDEEKTLLLTNLKKFLYYKKCKVSIEVKESCVVGDLQASYDGDVLNVERGIRSFFKNYNFGMVESNKKFFAIWKFEEDLKDKSKEVAYYLFNDKPDEKFVQQTQPESIKIELMACILRFLDPAEIAVILSEQLQIEDENNKSDFFIHEVKVASISEPMTDEEIVKDKEIPIKPDLRAYTALGDDGASLAGSFNQTNEILFKKDTRDKQQAANALVTLAMTKLFDPHLWYREVLDDILKMGDKLSDENSKNLPEADDEDAENVRNYLLPSEVERDFFLGVNQFVVDVEEETTTGKLNELTKSLEDFFNNNKMGIFRHEEIMLPIWKEESIFFTLDPRGKQSGNAAVHWYIDLQSLTEYLVECLEEAGGDFIIDGVSVQNKYIVTERSIEEFISEDQWYNFSKIAEGIWKIDCNVSIMDEMFQEENRGKQSAAICIMAIVFSKVYEPRQWSSEILDEITITGEQLHSRSANRLGENKSFHPNEIISEFFLANRRIDLCIQDSVQAGTFSGLSSKIQNINTGVSTFFEKSIAGCLTLAGSMNWAIWTYDDYFYCFEPGVSLMRFENVTLLSDQLLMYGKIDSDFEISSVNVVDWNILPPWKFDPSPAVRPSNLPPLNAYCKLSGIVAIPPSEPDDNDKKVKRTSKRKSSAARDSKKGKAKRIPPPPPPPILLEEGFNNFFDNYNAGILVTGRFMIAIWKDSGVYFMYDPRSRNNEGMKDDDNSEGSSCVVWFACMEPLFDLVFSNINNDEKYAKFEICRIIVKTVPIEPLPCPAGYKAINENTLRVTLNKSDCPLPAILPAELQERAPSMSVDLETSFERVDEELSILLGSSHMSARSFPAENRGHQSSAISCVAIAVAALHAPSSWTGKFLDAILKYGDVLHTECARLARPGSRNLSLGELLKVFVVGDVRARIRLHRNLAAGITLEHDLASALRLFFAKNASGIVHTANFALPVLEHSGKFYLLDPSDRHGFGNSSSTTAACFIKCNSVANLAKLIVRVCAFKEPTVYTLNALQVLDLYFFAR